MKKLRAFIKSFFHDSDGKFQPVYFWITAMMLLTIIAYVMRLCGVKHIDNAILLGVLGFVAAWIGLYNMQKKNGGDGNVKSD